MRVVVAPDSFKGTLDAASVAEALAAGWASVRSGDELVLRPQADGGEGSLDVIERSVSGAVRHTVFSVTGPDGHPVDASWLELPGGVAVVELALSSGLPLMGSLDPLGATTRGLGEVIAVALDAGATSLVIALGGSASTDAAAGALAALGLRLLDVDGETLPDGGGALSRLASVDRSALIRPPEVTLLTDVTATLFEAPAVFGPQKGATPADVATLEAALRQAHAILGGDATAPGSGAAGGTAYGFATEWGALMVPGAHYIADLTGVFDGAVDVLITGEGRFDSQSLTGKVVGTLLDEAAARGVTAHVIAGQVALDRPAVSLTDLAGSPEAAMADPARWLRAAGRQLATSSAASARAG